MKIGSTYNPHVITDPISPQAATARSGRVSPKDLKDRITSRSKDLLMRMFKHGAPQQKQLAGATINALDKGTFKPNPTTQLPVLQFGTPFEVNGEVGVLMANWKKAHDDELDLAAVGFQKQGGDLNGDSNPVVTLVLENAQKLPGAGPLAHLRQRPPAGNSLLKFVPTQEQSKGRHTAKTAKVIDKNSPQAERAKIIDVKKRTPEKRTPKILEHEFPPESFDHFRKENSEAFKDPAKNETRKAPARPAGGLMGKQLIDNLNESLNEAAKRDAYNKPNGDVETESVEAKLYERSSAYNALNGTTATKPGASNIGIKRSAERNISELPEGSDIRARSYLDQAVEEFLDKDKKGS